MSVDRIWKRLTFGSCVWIATVLVAVAAHGEELFRPVPEMMTPEGIIAGTRAERAGLSQTTRAAEAVARAEGWLRQHWPAARTVDLEEIARWDQEATRRSTLPSEPPHFVSRAIGHDASTGTWFVELRGPRLESELSIVARHLTFYAGVQFSAGNEPSVDGMTVTIRREVSE